MSFSYLSGDRVQHLLSATWFTIGTTPINFYRILGLLSTLLIVWWAIETELLNAGIEIPFPQRDIRFRGDSLQIKLDTTSIKSANPSK